MSGSDARQIYDVWDLGLSESVDATVDALIDDWEGFRILLHNHKTGGKIRIAFDTHVAYRNRDESDVVGELGRSDGAKRGQFYRVANSEFIVQFLRDTARPYIGERLRHFAIVTESACIDVLAESEPRVENLREAAKNLAAKSVGMQKKKSK
jgi:hypothetical protein